MRATVFIAVSDPDAGLRAGDHVDIDLASDVPVVILREHFNVGRLLERIEAGKAQIIAGPALPELRQAVGAETTDGPRPPDSAKPIRLLP